ncbi:MAG: hypothetical protein P1V81_11460 [Planctomycetota bacterium]|nr:hypothetical protein [Planctomycetota bacterium]
MTRRPTLIALLFWTASLPACLLVEQRTSSADPTPAIASLPGEAWTVLDATEAELGFVVRFEEIMPTQATARAFFSVRNPHGQELGLVDELGRAWRYRPHVHDPDWIGTGSITEGISAILNDGSDVLLQTADLDTIKNRLCLNSAELPTRKGS